MYELVVHHVAGNRQKRVLISFAGHLHTVHYQYAVRFLYQEDCSNCLVSARCTYSAFSRMCTVGVSMEDMHMPILYTYSSYIAL